MNDYNELKKIILVGNPISHSLSPVMQNAALKDLGLNYRFSYEAKMLKSSDLSGFIDKIKSGEVYGANITIPYKVDIVKYLDKLSKEAKLIGAVNTIYRNEVGEIIGHNTDGLGAIKSLESEGVFVKDKKVMLLGAGGAARAIAFSLTLSDVYGITVLSRRTDSAKNLCEDLSEKCNGNFKSGSFDEIPNYINDVDILINCSPVGMNGYLENESLVDISYLRSDLVVMDIVYTPLETILLKNARQKGCRVINGLGMLVWQGMLGIEKWTNKNASFDVMYKSVVEKLA